MRAPLIAVLAAAAFAAVGTVRVAEAKPGRALTEKEKVDLIALFRPYLDVDNADSFRARIALVRMTNDLRDKGANVFADVDGLLSMLYASRPFHPAFDKRNLPRGADKSLEVRADSGTGVTSVIWPGAESNLRLSLSLPPKYDKDPKKLIAMPPFPVVISLHEADDFQDAKGQKRYPGEEVLKRRWDKRGAMKPVVDEWLLYAPVATRARFVADGEVKQDTVPFSEVWTRYHVDFDRVVIEGGADALLFAASKPIYYAGVIVRDPKAEIPDSLVRNFASLPVYVVGGGDDSPAAKVLAKGGHPSVTKGPADGLVAWLQKLPPRRTPTKFSWTVLQPSIHKLAHWINVNRLEDGATEGSLEVEVVDTEKDPNTIRIAAKGIHDVSIFLSDRIVDLDKPVRVVANGKVVASCHVDVRGEDQEVALPAKFDRTLDAVFDAKWGSIRQGIYYGFLFPVLLEGVQIPAATAAPKDGASVAKQPLKPAGPVEEKNAQQYFEKATEARKEGNREKALRLFKKVIDEGATTYYQQAEANIKEIEEEIAKPADGAGEKSAEAPK